MTILDVTMKTEELLTEKKAEILDAAKRHGAYDVRIFGSAARGEFAEGSDIDFLVKASPSTSPWFPVGLVLDLEDILGCKVEVVTEPALHSYIRDRVLAEAVTL